MIGQDEAVKSVANALKRARSGLKDPSRPIATLMFCGPTGVGKTELTKVLTLFPRHFPLLGTDGQSACCVESTDLPEQTLAMYVYDSMSAKVKTCCQNLVNISASDTQMAASSYINANISFA